MLILNFFDTDPIFPYFIYIGMFLYVVVPMMTFCDQTSTLKALMLINA